MPTGENTTRISRRTVLKTALVAGAGVAGASAGLLGAAAPAAAQITHPGLLHTQADFDRMRARVMAGDQPWQAGWERLIANPRSHPGRTPNPQQTIVRGASSGENYHILYNDIHAAYQNALRWKIQNNTDHGDTARDICNAWSATLQEVTGNSNVSLAAGIYGYQFANVGEIMRGYPGFDLGRFQQMMNDIFYPLNLDFLVRHHGNCDSHYWANWDLCNMNSILAIGVLTDDQSKIDWAVDYFFNGVGNGAILNAIPHLHENDTLGQWQESGRDQGHTLMGVGQMGAFCEMAWNQGHDLYGAHDSRFAKACEYIAKYNLGNSVPFTDYYWESGHNCDPNTHTAISEHGRGHIRPVWERVYNHYVRRRGLTMPYTEQFAAEVRPEGGGGDYGHTSGGFDQLGFGTLTCTQDPSGGGPLPLGSRSLRSVNFSGRYIRHRDFLGFLDEVTSSSSSQIKEDATFTVVAGLAGGGHSLRAANGMYLRHQNYRIRLGTDDGSTLFAQDASFYAQSGTENGSVRLQSYNYPARYLRHRDYELWLDEDDGSDLFRDDSSFYNVDPWG
jgi:hypothetical protein